MLRIGQAHKQAPPVVNETNATGEQPAALQVLGRETTPAPVVLQFIKSILAIRPVTIQLAQSQNLADQRGHQSSVFPNLPLVTNFGKAEQWQLGMRAVDNRQRAIELAAQQDAAAAGSSPSAASLCPCPASPGPHPSSRAQP